MPLSLAYGYASRAVLIGSSAGYPPGPDAPRRVLHTLRTLLLNDIRWGLDPDNCAVLIDESADEVSQAVRTACDGVGARGLLLFCFTGPVSLDPRGNLELLLPGDALPYRAVRWWIRQSEARQRLVILDGLETPVTAGSLAAVNESLDRASLLAYATAPGVTTPPALTTTLVNVLQNGLARGPNLIGLHDLVGAITDRMRTAGLPAPVLVPHDTADTMALIRNPALYRADRVGQVLVGTAPVAGPKYPGPVVLILRYDKDEGALGVVLDRPRAKDVTLPAGTWPTGITGPSAVYRGGPVVHEGYIPLVLLRPGVTAPAQFRPVRRRLGTLALNTAVDVADIERFKLFNGYVGWGPGELESDLAAGLVVPVDVDVDVVLDADRLRRTVVQPDAQL